MAFKGVDVLSAAQFSREEFDHLLRGQLSSLRNCKRASGCGYLMEKSWQHFFYQPSTRTR